MRTKYPQPETAAEEVLLAAIIHGHVDCIMFGWLSGFRTRVSELIRNYGIRFTPENISMKNKHGHPMVIVRHHLKAQADKDHALGVYLKMKKQLVS